MQLHFSKSQICSCGKSNFPKFPRHQQNVRLKMRLFVDFRLSLLFRDVFHFSRHNAGFVSNFKVSLVILEKKIHFKNISIKIRCVDDNIRSFALGIQWIVVRILGTIPAPMVFGRLIDESCILWEQDSCGFNSGSCLLYDNKNMAKYMLLLALIGKLCSILFFFLSWFYYIPPKVSDIYQGDEKKREVYIKKESENEKYWKSLYKLNSEI